MSKPKILQQLNAEKASKILLASDPTQNMEAASKQYVDNSGGVYYASPSNTFNEILAEYNKGKIIKYIYSATNTICDLIHCDSNYMTFTYTLPGEIDNKTITLNSNNQIIGSWADYSGQYINELETELPIKLYDETTPISSTVQYYRPILISTKEPTSNDGNIGDIWFVYEA